MTSTTTSRARSIGSPTTSRSRARGPTLRPWGGSCATTSSAAPRQTPPTAVLESITRLAVSIRSADERRRHRTRARAGKCAEATFRDAGLGRRGARAEDVPPAPLRRERDQAPRREGPPLGDRDHPGGPPPRRRLARGSRTRRRLAHADRAGLPVHEAADHDPRHLAGAPRIHRHQQTARGHRVGHEPTAHLVHARVERRELLGVPAVVGAPAGDRAFVVRAARARPGSPGPPRRRPPPPGRSRAPARGGGRVARSR